MGWIPAIAAASKRRREQRQEEEMIQRLQQDDPQGLYEYKVLRSHTFAFSSETRLQEVLDEEGRAGWEMATKLDYGRLMMRRQRSRREADGLLPPGVEPYRTTVDANIPLLAALVIPVLLVVGLLGIIPGVTAPMPIVIILAIILVGIIVIAVAALVRSWR